MRLHNELHPDRLATSTHNKYKGEGFIANAIEQALIEGNQERVVEASLDFFRRYAQHDGITRDAGRLSADMSSYGLSGRNPVHRSDVLAACIRLARNGFQDIDEDPEPQRRAMGAVYGWVRRERCDVGWADYLLFAGLVALCCSVLETEYV